MATRTLWARFRVNKAELDALKEKAHPKSVSEWLRELAGLEPIDFKFSATVQPKKHGGGWPKGKPRKKIVKLENKD